MEEKEKLRACFGVLSPGHGQAVASLAETRKMPKDTVSTMEGAKVMGSEWSSGKTHRHQRSNSIVFQGEEWLKVLKIRGGERN